MKLQFTKEFTVGKHHIGYLSERFTTEFKGQSFRPVAGVPIYQTLSRYMTDAEIETELKPGLCTLGDLLVFLDNAPKECRDGFWNLFYFPSFVVDVYWSDSLWSVGTWLRGGCGWSTGCRVFSPATGSSDAVASSGTLTLESLSSRIERLERIINLETE